MNGPGAVIFAASCKEFGVDPARAAGIEDPWLAAQLRAGLLYRLREDEAKAQEQSGGDPMHEMRAEHMERLDRMQTMFLGNPPK